MHFLQPKKIIYDVRSRLKDIKVPTLVTVGRYDWICPLPQSEYIAFRISNAKLAIFEKSNHPVHIEENEKFLAVTRDFIENWGKSI